MRVVQFLLAIFLVSIMNHLLSAEVIYRPLQLLATSSWQDVNDQQIVAPSSFEIDWNSDSIPDLTVGHRFDPKPFRISSEAAVAVQAAGEGMSGIATELEHIRQIVVESGSHDFLSRDQIVKNQAAIVGHIEQIDTITDTTKYLDRHLLNGDAGVHGFTSSGNVTLLRAIDKTHEGTSAVTIDTAAEKATVRSGNALTSLGQNETLTINHKRIAFEAGMTVDEVVTRINQYSPTTNVNALVDELTKEIILLSRQFGSASEINVVSDISAHQVNSTGFGTTEQNDLGINAIVTIGGVQFNGQAHVVTADSGYARGITIELGTNPDMPWQTVEGHQGTVTILDNSLRFVSVGQPESTAKLTIPSLKSKSLGIGVSRNLFSNLNEITVSTELQTRKSLDIVNASIQDVGIREILLGEFLDRHYFPTGIGEISSQSLTQFATDESGIALLSGGTEIGPDLEFSEGHYELAGQFGEHQNSGYIGFRFLNGDELSYGWMQIEIEDDNSFSIMGYAFEDIAGQTIAAGQIPANVPEPKSTLPLLLAITLFIRFHSNHRNPEGR